MGDPSHGTRGPTERRHEAAQAAAAVAVAVAAVAVAADASAKRLAPYPFATKELTYGTDFCPAPDVGRTTKAKPAIWE